MILETGKDLIEFMQKKFTSRQAEEKNKDWQELKRKIIPDYKYYIETTSTTGVQLRARIQTAYEEYIVKERLGDICE